jgi:hypothetical protein
MACYRDNFRFTFKELDWLWRQVVRKMVIQIRGKGKGQGNRGGSVGMTSDATAILKRARRLSSKEVNGIVRKDDPLQGLHMTESGTLRKRKHIFTAPGGREMRSGVQSVLLRRRAEECRLRRK